jgi:metal-responsive CopG/Arc/MetJ family transcriptional regulator
VRDVNTKTEKSRPIEIPESLFERVEARIKGTGFQSVSDYVVHILREELANEGKEQVGGYTKEEEEKVKERLRALGYL